MLSPLGTRWDLVRDFASVLDEVSYTPLALTICTFWEDLELWELVSIILLRLLESILLGYRPHTFKSHDIWSSRIVTLCKISSCRVDMSWTHWICFVPKLCAIKCVVPFCGQFIGDCSVDDFLRDSDKTVWTSIADNTVGGYIGYWAFVSAIMPSVKQ